MIIVEVHDEGLGTEVVWSGPEHRVRRIHNLVVRKVALAAMAAGKDFESGIYRARQVAPIQDKPDVNPRRSR